MVDDSKRTVCLHVGCACLNCTHQLAWLLEHSSHAYCCTIAVLTSFRHWLHMTFINLCRSSSQYMPLDERGRFRRGGGGGAGGFNPIEEGAPLLSTTVLDGPPASSYQAPAPPRGTPGRPTFGPVTHSNSIREERTPFGSLLGPGSSGGAAEPPAPATAAPPPAAAAVTPPALATAPARSSAKGTYQAPAVTLGHEEEEEPFRAQGGAAPLPASGRPAQSGSTPLVSEAPLLGEGPL
jgi:hypothetical protein